MERWTARKAQGGYEALGDAEGLLEALGRYEDFHEGLLLELEELKEELERLRGLGRQKSVTYRQLFANQLSLEALIRRLQALERKP